MRNVESWKPTKFSVDRNGRLSASSDHAELSPASWLGANLIAEQYNAALPEHARGRLIDLGCGKVPLFGAYRSLVNSVTCVDWANSRVPNQHLDLEHDLTQPIPLPDASFDTIILSDVLEHIPVPESLWSEMARLLAKGGKLIMNVPFFYKLHAQPYDYYRYTEFALRRFAGQHGFKVLYLAPTGGSLEILTDIVCKHLLYVPVAGPWIGWLLQRAAFAFTRVSLGRRILRKTGTHFPFSYFLVAEKV